MTVIHSSDLGWTAGEDISDEFAALAKTFKPGDTFVFDHMYEISGSKIQLPDNFTLAGGAPGAGIDVVDSNTNSAPLFFLGNANTLVDLTVLYSNSPELVTEVPDYLKVQVGVDYDNKRTFVADDKDDIKVLNSHFEGNVSIHLDIAQGENLLIQDTEFAGGYYQVRFGADVTNPTIDSSLFRNSLGDGIKTGSGDYAQGTSGVTVTDSVFLKNFRDGIDTTGGFRDSVVIDSYFVGNGISGLDIKEGYNSQDDFALGGPLNENILITNSEFVDNPSAVVVTTLDRFNMLTAENSTQWAIQNIRIEDSIVENTNSNGGSSKMFLVKDSYNIHWQDVTFLGNVTEAVLKSEFPHLGLPKDINGTGVTTGQSRGEQSDVYYQGLAGPDWSNITYPTDGTVTPVEPVVEPDPISYSPPQQSEPVVEAPAPSNGAPVANDDVATAGHDKTILVDVLGNDQDPDGDGLTLTKVSYSGNTSTVSIENGRIKVNPLRAATEERVETIVYTVSDGEGGTDTAELKVNVEQAAAPAPKPEPIVEAPVEPEPVAEAPVPQPEPIVEVPTPQPEPVLEAPKGEDKYLPEEEEILASKNDVVEIDKKVRADILGSNDFQDVLDTGLIDGLVSLLGGRGKDNLKGSEGDDAIFGDHGKDKLNGGEGDDVLFGGGDKDRLKGGDGDDVISGGKGKDKLKGGDGNDAISGGRGDDIFYGGNGKDSFTFTSNKSGDDVIKDWEDGRDIIDLTAFDIRNEAKFIKKAVSKKNGDAYIDLEFADAAGFIKIEDAAGDIGLSDFIF